MKTLKYTVGGKELSITLNNAGRVVSVDGAEPTAEEMAVYAGVISLALAQYEVEDVHDDEPVNTITIQRKCTPWNDPSRQFNHK
ncbi:MAG: hypothetical protein Q4D23_06345 [Bacteroidales bacterium]|nr:hypothetical protein [Bacteroidales bacterium]